MRIHGAFISILCAFSVGCGIEAHIILDPPSLIGAETTTLVNAFGGDSLEIQGTNFTTDSSLLINEQKCSSISYDSLTNMRCTLPGLRGIGNMDLKLIFNDQPWGFQSDAVKAFAVKGRQLSEGDQPVKYGMRVPFKVMMCGSKFVALDSLNYRLLVWNSVPTSSATPFDSVIGQPSFYNTSANAGATTNAYSFSTAYSFTCYQDKLLVADNGNSRVLIWNQFPTTSTTPADVVLGQPDFTSNTAHNGGVSAQSLREVSDLTVDKNGRLYVVDSVTASRVLIWNSIPNSNFAAADLVLGQTSFSATGGATSQTRLNTPLGVLAVEDQLFVSDQSHRILVWNSLPTIDTQPADLVLGQTTFTAATSGVSAVKFNRPYQMTTDGTRLVVSDTNNHRILVWNSLPTATNTPADLVLGQATVTSNGVNNPAISASSLNGPAGVGFAPVGGVDRLFACDNGNHRILGWSTFPSLTGQAANVVLGQGAFTASGSNWSPSTSATTLLDPLGAFYNGSVLVIADSAHHRVLLWKTFPESNTTPPDVILGQSSIDNVSENAGGTVAANTLKSPRNVSIIGDKLVVVDSGNHRVLIWNTLPTTHQQSADLVLGQSSFTVGSANGGGAVSASTMSGPTTVTYAGDRLYVSDSSNHRVLFWNSFPTASTTAADGVLGQPNLTSNTFNNGGIGASTMRSPVGLSSDGTHLAIADTLNNRVLVWTSTPTSSAPADLVLGQPNFLSSTANTGTGKQKLNNPISAAIYSGSLYITDRGNNRVLRFGLSSLTNQADAEEVLGQANFNDTTSGGGALYRLNVPEALQVSAHGIVLADKLNQRVLMWPWP